MSARRWLPPIRPSSLSLSVAQTVQPSNEPLHGLMLLGCLVQPALSCNCTRPPCACIPCAPSQSEVNSTPAAAAHTMMRRCSGPAGIAAAGAAAIRPKQGFKQRAGAHESLTHKHLPRLRSSQACSTPDSLLPLIPPALESFREEDLAPTVTTKQLTSSIETNSTWCSGL
jgi:hypothetical protein